MRKALWHPVLDCHRAFILLPGKKKKQASEEACSLLVGEAGLEPARPQWTLEPESSESTNSTTRPYNRSRISLARSFPSALRYNIMGCVICQLFFSIFLNFNPCNKAYNGNSPWNWGQQSGRGIPCTYTYSPPSAPTGKDSIRRCASTPPGQRQQSLCLHSTELTSLFLLSAV